MSVRGQEQTSSAQMPMSALLLKGDIAEGDCHVRLVPCVDVYGPRLIAGSTGSALRAVRPPNLHITPDVRRDLVYAASATGSL